jgi:hypothetical protein
MRWYRKSISSLRAEQTEDGLHVRFMFLPKLSNLFDKGSRRGCGRGKAKVNHVLIEVLLCKKPLLAMGNITVRFNSLGYVCSTTH